VESRRGWWPLGAPFEWIGWVCTNWTFAACAHDTNDAARVTVTPSHADST